MRTFARAFGVVCGAVVVAIAARYGFKTSDNDFDGYIWAFTYGAVTTGGLFGHAVALRVWRHDKWTGLAAGVISALALVISLSNSLGAMAGRGNEQQATRIQVAETVRDLRRGLESAASERRGLKFEPVDEAAVNAAKAKAAAASAAKEAECKWRSGRCRDKETTEAATLAALETATKNKAATDRAAKLDADIAAFREKIEKAGPVLEANSQGNALARLFNLPEAKAATLSTYQNLAMALVIELLIVMSMVASEVLEHHETKAPTPAPNAVSGRRIEPEAITAAEAVRAPEKATEAAPVAEALSYDEEPKAFPAPPRPRLISSQASPVGSVPVILAEIMEPGRGKIGLLELFSAYAEACRGKGNEPVSASEFSHTVAALCERLGIQIEDDDDGVFLMGVKLKGAASKKKSVKLRTAT
jgi:hypothetical protein